MCVTTFGGILEGVIFNQEISCDRRRPLKNVVVGTKPRHSMTNFCKIPIMLVKFVMIFFFHIQCAEDQCLLEISEFDLLAVWYHFYILQVFCNNKDKSNLRVENFSLFSASFFFFFAKQFKQLTGKGS